jgi:nicotinamidase-related amidase
MRQRRYVFVDVDTQRDFLDPDGTLFIRGAEAIRPNLARLAAFAREHRIPVIATACAHEPDEADPEPFPPHCLVGTPGADRIEETRTA